MRILLPPSEAKLPGGRGANLDRRSADPAFQPVRDQVQQALRQLLAGPGASAALLLPPSVAAASLAENGRLRVSPTMPALRRYAGVVYDGLAADALSPAARTLANRELLIFSGLFGVVRGGEAIPAYRVPAKAGLPGIGILSTFWRRHLPELMPPLLDRGAVVDLRSTDYASMWQPAEEIADRVILVRVLSRRPDGSLGVISFNSKLAKGRLAAALLERRAAKLPVAKPADVAAAWLALGGSDVVERPGRTGCALDLVEASPA